MAERASEGMIAGDASSTRAFSARPEITRSFTRDSRARNVDGRNSPDGATSPGRRLPNALELLSGREPRRRAITSLARALDRDARLRRAVHAYVSFDYSRVTLGIEALIAHS